MTYRCIELSIDRWVATLTLNRPEKMNALDDEILLEMQDALDRLEHCSMPEFAALIDSLRTLYRGPLLPGVELAVVAARRLALQRRVQRGLQAAGQRLGSLGHADAAAMASAACESLPDL